MATSPDALGPGPTGRPALARILAIAGAVLLVLLLVWFFFLRADEAPLDDAAAPAPPPVVETPEPSETVNPAPKKGPVETFEVFAPKDPFDPLISAATAGGGGTAGGGTGTDGTGGDGDGTTGDGTTGNGTTGNGTTGNGRGTTTTTTTTSGGGGGGDNVGGHRVRVIDVGVRNGSPRAQIQVDGTVYTVDEGERFAQNFRLLSTSGRCATLLFGDDEFTLCEGEEILK